MTKSLWVILSALLFLIACGGDDSGQRSSEWAIPSNEVFDGGVGQDGIPSLDQPQFSSISETDFLSDPELVVGIVHNGVAKAYPHVILDWHEIVNDDVTDLSVALTYCPLTGTAVGWNREVNGQNMLFGVSGKLFNTNLMPFDRTTQSYWTQLGLNCVNGDLINTEIGFVPVIETTWGTWKAAYPDSEVLNTNTGFSRSYGVYPYGDYRTNNNNIIFPVDPLDLRLPSKERVLGVIGETTNRAYTFDLFEEDTVIHDELDGTDMIILGSESSNYLVGYENNLGLTGVTSVDDSLPIIARSEDGNGITLDGRIIEGPLTGQVLNPTRSWIGYWMSFGAFYPGIEIYE